MNVFYRLLIPVVGLFVLTVFAMIASAFAGSGGSLLDQHAVAIILVEVAATLVIGLLAMLVDRRRMLREYHRTLSERKATPSNPDASGAPSEETA
jgi:hypothetical protein